MNHGGTEKLVSANTVNAELQKLVTGVLDDSASLEIPEQFQPVGDLYQIGPLFFSNVDEDFDEDVEKIQADIDTFFTSRPVGTYRIGYWGHGANSYGIYLQSRSDVSTLFLRLYFGGIYGDNAEALARINSYLAALSDLVDECDQRGISVEVCESMEFGYYRFFTADGQRIEFEESLTEEIDPRQRFNKMIAKFAVEITKRNEMNIFNNDDNGYRIWLRANDEAFVINAENNPRPDEVVLHRSGCWTVNSEEKNYTHGNYQKVCSPTRSPLMAWSIDQTGQNPRECVKCLG